MSTHVIAWPLSLEFVAVSSLSSYPSCCTYTICGIHLGLDFQNSPSLLAELMKVSQEGMIVV